MINTQIHALKIYKLLPILRNRFLIISLIFIHIIASGGSGAGGGAGGGIGGAGGGISPLPANNNDNTDTNTSNPRVNNEDSNTDIDTNTDNSGTNSDNSNTRNNNTNPDNPIVSTVSSDTNTNTGSRNNITYLGDGIDHAIDNSLKECDIISTDGRFHKDGLHDSFNFSTYWAQRAIGADLLKKEIEKKGTPPGKKLIEAIAFTDYNYNTHVSNLISGAGEQAILPEMGDKKSVSIVDISVSELSEIADRYLNKADQECTDLPRENEEQNTESGNE